MDSKPILIFPSPLNQGRTKKRQNPPQFSIPDKDKQIGKFGGVLANLSLVLKNQTAQLFPSIKGLTPELVLVIEVAGTIDEFFKAVEKTPGMEFLAQYKGDFFSDDDFYYPDDKEKRIESRIFLTMSNQQGIDELLSYWRLWKEDSKLKHGTSKFKDLFKQLKDIRPYNVSDRFRDTGFDLYHKEQLSFGASNINFEIELAYSAFQNKRRSIVLGLQEILAKDGGHIVSNSETTIDDISYHGLIANAPISSFQTLTENTKIAFIKFPWILYFRPVGQTLTQIKTNSTDKFPEFVGEDSNTLIEEPTIALFDGLPLSNHSLLSSRIIIDDPDNFSNNYIAKNRLHGTLMSSLIIHGDLNDKEQPLNRKIYIRPIMVLQQRFSDYEECMPNNVLPVDIIHRAIKRIVSSPALRSIKIINLSICDPYQPFLNNISTFAKLLDWLAYKYDLLFIVSAGNYVEHIELSIPPHEFSSLTPSQKQHLIIESLLDSQFKRKILSPAESINSLTVGAIYDDSSQVSNIGSRIEPYNTNVLPSSISRIGYGINKSLKPDVFLKGGRTLYRIKPSNTTTSKTLLSVIPNNFTIAPGNLTAHPGLQGQISALGYSSGTSNATALVTRQAARLLEIIEEINQENENIKIPKSYYSVLIKTLLAHYSYNSEAWNLLEGELRSLTSLPDQIRKSYLYQNIGYGTLNIFKLGFCTDYRVTLLGFGELTKDNANVYSFPLPNAISGKPIEKKLIISLGWFSPLNFKSGKYRQAALFFDNIRVMMRSIWEK